MLLSPACPNTSILKRFRNTPEVGELIRHQVEPASDRSWRPYGRRVLTEPRESVDCKKAMTWYDQQEFEPRSVPRPAEGPSQDRDYLAPAAGIPSFPVLPMPAPVAPATGRASVNAPAGPTTGPYPGHPGHGEVPAGMRMEPITFKQAAEPVSRELAGKDLQMPQASPSSAADKDWPSALWELACVAAEVQHGC